MENARNDSISAHAPLPRLGDGLDLFSPERDIAPRLRRIQEDGILRWRASGIRVSGLSQNCPCELPKQGIQSQRQPTRLIGEREEAEGFTTKIEDARKADFRLADALRGSLEVFDLTHPAGQWVPSRENLVHQRETVLFVSIIATNDR
jgi:hypothetical protein